MEQDQTFPTTSQDVTPEVNAEQSVTNNCEKEQVESANSETESSKVPEINFSTLSCNEIVNEFKKLLSSYPIQDLKESVEPLPEIFEKQFQAEYNVAFAAYSSSNEDASAFVFDDSIRDEFNSLNKEYHEKKAAYNKQIEEEREDNLKQKLQLIEDLKGLVQKEESLNKTFQDFRDIQERWRNIGYVPASAVEDLQKNYHLHTENFYNYIKINKELRDLDLKRNSDAKTALCEAAEKLLEEQDIADAFKKLQDLHAQWKEIGPIPKEQKETMWERFKTASSAINDKYHTYCESLRKDLDANLATKNELCQKAEIIANGEYKSTSEWNKATQKLLELQEIWKTVGAVSYKERNKIFKIFRTHCNLFFDRKRDFYKALLVEQEANLKLKTDLCEKVEAIKDSSEWKATMDKIIYYQKEWKKIGPAPQRYSNKIWQRFRTACDSFFERKNEFFKDVDAQQEKNLIAKKELIEEIRNFKLTDNNQDNIAALKAFQAKWGTIGFVPMKEKEAIQEEYRKVIDQHFDNLNMDEFNKNLEKFKVKIHSLSNENTEHKIVGEREKLVIRIKQLENDINTWENNIGFFAKSKKSDQLVNELKHKIESTKQRLDLFNAKLKALDNMI